MNTYVILLRGINVGGKNLIPMAGLRKCLEDQGFSSVTTYIASGNVILRSDKNSTEVETQIAKILPESFKLDDGFVKLLVLTPAQLQAIVDHKPDGFGEQPETYHSDVVFLLGIDSAKAITAFAPREGVDRVWAGDSVIYSQRLSSMRTKSRLSKIVESPCYPSMTIRNWNTTSKLLDLSKQLDAIEEGVDLPKAARVQPLQG